MPLLRPYLFVASSLMLTFLAAAAVAIAEDGTPHNGPHNVPGAIRAADFNDGASGAAYSAATPGNQGGYSAYRPDTDVDIANGPGGPYVISSDVAGRVRDWLKYTIAVSQTGWYRIDYFARVISPAPRAVIATSVDGRPLGFTNRSARVQTEYDDIFAGPIFMRAGQHVLGVLLAGALLALDHIEIAVAPPPPVQTPRIVSAPVPGVEVIVADAVVTDAPFQADPTGTRDATAAVNDALQAVSLSGGGTVFLPAGTYRIDGQLFVPPNTTLRGADPRDRSDPRSTRTLLLASFGKGDESAGSFISLAIFSCARDLSVWYPSQGFTVDTIQPYPFTISFDENGANALNVKLFNSYNGIAVNGGSAHTLADVVGTALRRGVVTGNGYDFSWMYNIEISNDSWKTAPRELIPNGPVTDADRVALDTFTSTNLVGVQIGENDGYDVYDVRVRDAHQDVLVQRLPTDSAGLWGILSKISGQVKDVDSYPIPDLHSLITDTVPGVSAFAYSFRSPRGPANGANFYNVAGPSYGAFGDGLADDTAAIQRALDAAGQAGGGTVYLPPGQYKIGHLGVPTGVELRGPHGGDNHFFEASEACTLLADEGKNTASPEASVAMITLASNAGIRGFDIAYPEQGYGSPDAPVAPYPFTIRGAGEGVWVSHVSVLNAYNLIDLATFRCDDHLVSGVRATVFNTGILVGGGSDGGTLERVEVSWGVLYESFRLTGPLEGGMGSLAAYAGEHTIPFQFGRSSRETTWGANSFAVHVGWQMLADGEGCTDSTFWQSISDTSQDVGYLLEGGDNLRFVGLGSGTCNPCLRNWLIAAPSFTGTADVYGTMTWGNVQPRSLAGGTVRFHSEGSLTLGKATTATSVQSGNPASDAVDASESTKWASATGGTNSLTVDLDQPSEIERWVVRHAGTNGEPDELNTSSFELQVSEDGVNFSTADSVAFSAVRLTDRRVLTRARYARLFITQGTVSGDGRARIYEFEAHGREGWQFTNDAEGWAPLTDISSFAVQDGNLEISSSGSQPTIASPDNLSIAASRLSALKVRLKNSGAPTSATLFFATQADPTFSEAKSLTVGSVVSSPEFVDYLFDCSSNAGWTGTIRQLRLTPIRGAGAASIDSIALEPIDPQSRVVVPPAGRNGKPRVVLR